MQTMISLSAHTVTLPVPHCYTVRSRRTLHTHTHTLSMERPTEKKLTFPQALAGHSSAFWVLLRMVTHVSIEEIGVVKDDLHTHTEL